MLSNGKYGIIIKTEIKELEEPEVIYNFEVADFHTFGQEGILVHNDCITDDLTKIANQYGNKQCVEASNAMSKYLDAKGVPYEKVNIQYNTTTRGVWSTKINGVIADNGYHTGIKLLGKYNGLVFDNIYKTGISYAGWISGFEGPLGSSVAYYSGERIWDLASLMWR